MRCLTNRTVFKPFKRYSRPLYYKINIMKNLLILNFIQFLIKCLISLVVYRKYKYNSHILMTVQYTLKLIIFLNRWNYYGGSTVHCTAYIFYCTLYTVHFPQYTIHRTFSTVHCTPYIFRCTLYTVHFPLYTVHRTFSTVHCAPYIFDCKMYTVRFPLYATNTVHFGLYISHCNTVHRTFCTVHCTMLI